MVTKIPDVLVTRVEADNGFLVLCSDCPRVRTIFPTRHAADAYAAKHRSSHQRPDPADQDWL